MDNPWIQKQLAGLDALFGNTVQIFEVFLFADFGSGLPLIVAVLLLGGIYYSFFFSWLTFCTRMGLVTSGISSIFIFRSAIPKSPYSPMTHK